MKASLGISMMALCGVLIGPVFAVERGVEGRGEALIVPLWTTGVGANPVGESSDTLLTITNHRADPKAVKVRMIDVGGVELGSFNLYLDGHDIWTMGMLAHPQDQARSALASRDKSCTMPVIATSPDAPALSLFELDAPGRAGYLEIIEMGVPDPDSDLVVMPDDQSGEPFRWQDCNALKTRFEDGIWAVDPAADLLPPDGGLSADVQIIDAFAGGMTSLEAFAIDNFSIIVQHSPPGGDVPNLSTAHTQGADEGITLSSVCTVDGCELHLWSAPVQAVASVLATRSLRADVVANSDIGAVTELVFTRPLKRFEATMGTGLLIDSQPELAVFDRAGMPISIVAESVELSAPSPSARKPAPLGALDRDRSVVVIQFGSSPGASGSATSSPILGLPEPAVVALEGSTFSSGFAEVEYVQTKEQKLQSLVAFSFSGEPVLGTVFRQVVNGTLADSTSMQPVLANYRGSELMLRQVEVVRPER